MWIGICIFEINDLTFIFGALKPGVWIAPNSPGIGHDADAIIANDEGSRQIEIINVFDGLMKNACFSGHVPAE